MSIKTPSSKNNFRINFYENNNSILLERRRSIVFNSLISNSVYKDINLKYSIDFDFHTNMVIEVSPDLITLISNALNNRAGSYKNDINFKYICLDNKVSKFFRPLYRQKNVLDYLLADTFKHVASEVKPLIKDFKSEIASKVKTADKNQNEYFSHLVNHVIKCKHDNLSLILINYNLKNLRKIINKNNKYIIFTTSETDTLLNREQGFETWRLDKNNDDGIKNLKLLKKSYDSYLNNNASPQDLIIINDISYEIINYEESFSVKIKIKLTKNIDVNNTSHKTRIGFSITNDRYRRIYSYDHNFDFKDDKVCFEYFPKDLKFLQYNYYIYVAVFIDNARVWKTPIPIALITNKVILKDNSIGAPPKTGFITSDIEIHQE